MRHRDNENVHDSAAQRLSRRTLLGLSAAALVGAGTLATAGSSIFAQDGTPRAGDATTDACASPSASPVATASSEASPAAAVCPAGPVVHTVDLAFEPNELTIPANTDVVVTIENLGQLEHDFTLDELDVKSDLLGHGETTTVTINGAPGTYTFFCSVPGHKEAGMVGALTIQ